MATTDPLNPEKLPGNQPIKTTAPLVGILSVIGALMYFG
jgi:hypothetical protein